MRKLRDTMSKALQCICQMKCRALFSVDKRQAFVVESAKESSACSLDDTESTASCFVVLFVKVGIFVLEIVYTLLLSYSSIYADALPLRDPQK